MFTTFFLAVVNPLKANLNKNLDKWCVTIGRCCKCYGDNFWILFAEMFKTAIPHIHFLAATKQLYKWYFPSVRPSICPSVCLSVTPFWLCSHHRIIMKFSGVITNDQSKVHAKGQGQRSKVKVTEVTTQLNRFRTVTPVWIDIWWNDAYITWCCLEEVPYCFSRSSVKFQGHTALKIVEFDLDWAFPDCNSSLNSPMATKWCIKLEVE